MIHGASLFINKLRRYDKYFRISRGTLQCIGIKEKVYEEWEHY